MRRALVWVSLSVVVLALSACTTSNAHSKSSTVTKSGGIEIRSEKDFEAGRTFPLDTYSLSDTQLKLIRSAAYLLAGHCMNARGFTMPPTDTGAQASQLTNRLERMFSSGVLSQAQTYGYESPPGDTGTPPPLSAEESNPAFITAMVGDFKDQPKLAPIGVGGGNQVSVSSYAPNSCLGKAYSALSVVDPRRISIGYGSGIVDALVTESLDRATADTKATAVTGAWSACMDGKGYTATVPIDFGNLYTPTSKTYNGASKPAEIAAATADVQCKYDTNYFGVMFSLVVSYQNSAIESELNDLQTLQKENAAILAKANDAIKNG